MVSQQQLSDYAAAVAQERAAWNAVKDRLPGTPSHNEQLWRRWREAVANADVHARRIRRAALKSTPPADGSTQPGLPDVE